MKKMFFTAIALVAFSGVSMAETGAVKDANNENVQITIRKRDCDLIASSNLSNWEEYYGCIEDTNAYNSLYSENDKKSNYVGWNKSIQHTNID